MADWQRPDASLIFAVVTLVNMKQIRNFLLSESLILSQFPQNAECIHTSPLLYI